MGGPVAVVSECILNEPAKFVAFLSLSWQNPHSLEERGSGQAVLMQCLLLMSGKWPGCTNAVSVAL